ncbi:PREDICTED: NK-tumor recognition protein isoform X1 [Miniopterus natalensis]|uniref:NK-tumor recognition protein isoform X1 n=2 Tax=Miniopterus natalensis TaxID=291302 RepID=UPI0007A7235A|nr:PREDICTED: NK-tumor recognition protein isoform X1 [Miniopterus natalensis]
MGAQDRPQCHFDIEINREPVGRIMFQLFSDICPKTCKNFLCLCSGEKGLGKTTGKKLCYKGSTFHRVVKNFMIQGGDFSEGNGKGGESIYGGYFKDENFILKHDRAFLLSMANRGKHTNGSQFFITTKPAPHLDGVHVVFGLVISGFEVIEQIENLKTDAASRPYADVRVIDCGVLATKSTKDVFEKKRKKPTHSEDSDSSSSSSSSSESSSESEADRERSRRRKRKRRPRAKRSRKRRKAAGSSEEPRNKHAGSPKGHSERSDTNEKRSVDSNAKREKPVVRPEEIPPVPENRFLLRRDMPLVAVEPEPKIPDATPIVSDQKPSVSKSGRKIKGRGTIRYHTPPRSRSCSESDDDDSSETPPHWKEEMQRLRAYRPPSGEKWSKGDKLSDPCSSRWDERSLSQRSWSYNGYYSDLSTARHSDGHHKKRRKEKKVKHKKKAKKQKHCRRHKQTKKRRIIVPSDIESSKSSSRRMKLSCERERRSRSSSLSSHSSKRDWSRSDKDDQSSSTHSSRDSDRSKSHSQSYSRGSSRSRTPSKSSSHSRSRSKSRSSSKSGHQRTASKSPRRTASQLSENKPVKTEPLRATVPQNETIVVQPPVVAEHIPVIPLSDSPPPSRWKPGQKPWKPSYERIQEMKAKTTHLLPIQSTYCLANIKETGSSSSYHKREKNSESDRSAYSKYSDRSSESSPRSRSRSSRSRSYSRSYTRSRSVASSHSRSRSRSHSSRSHSRNKYSDRSQCSRSSSYSSVSSDAGRRAKRKLTSNGKKNSTSNKRHSSSSEKALRSKYVKGRDKSSRQRKYSESRSSLDDSSDSEHSGVQVTQSAQEKEKQVQVEVNNRQEKNRGGEKSKPEQECPRSKKRTLKENLSDHFRNGSKPKRKNYAGSKWDSESNSERDVTKNSKNNSPPSSDKEEGEATSDSESEFSEIHVKAKPTTKSANSSLPDGDGAWKSSKRRSSTSDSEGSCCISENPRGKPRKHKHGSKESLKREHTKKVKEKMKGKKDKKHKAPKRKQAFHWQPPLEFGEEEEEETNEKQVTQEPLEKKQTSENSETTKENTPQTEKPCEDGSLSDKQNTATLSSDAEQPAKDSKPHSSLTPLNTEDNVTSSPANGQHVEESAPGGVEVMFQADDNMEICTPDRTSPAKVEGASPLGNSRLDTPDTGIVVKQEMQAEHPEAQGGKQESSVPESPLAGEVGKPDSNSGSGSASALESAVSSGVAERGQVSLLDNKWKPLPGVGNLAAPPATCSAVEVKALTAVPEMKPQGLRIEIKSKNKVRPGSLFDEVRKTARLNRRPRNQESSSEEQTPSRDGDSQSRSPSRSRSKSETKSRHRTRSVSYSHSRSRSRSSSSSYRSRSYSRSRSRGWYSRGRTRSRSSSSRSYKSHRTSSRSRSRSSSYDPHSRSRSYTYDSYYSRSRSRSRSQRSDSYHRGRSYNRRSRSCRSYGSDSESDRSYSHHRSPSESSRYS